MAELLGESAITRSAAGAQLGPYKIEASIGAGGMGEVFRATDTRLHRTVAIKVLPHDKVSDPERKKRFLQEARAASALNHPNIVTLYDIANDGGTDFLVMEYVPGKSLGKLIPPKGMPPSEVIGYAVQIASALAAAHTAGIVHRDVKPGNVIVTPEGQVKILDFGLAKLQERPVGAQSEMGTTEPTLTEVGVVMGTVAYMSPEQARAEEVDARTDLFSFGAVLYEMVTGVRAFQRQSTASTLAALFAEEPKPVRQLAPDVPLEIERIIGRCLRKDREARYPSVTALTKDLEDCNESLAASSTGAIDLKRLARAVKRPMVAVPVLLMLLVLAASAAWLFQRNARIRWATNQALPEISRLSNDEKYAAAYSLAERAETYLPGDPSLSKLWPVISRLVTLETRPAGADVFRKTYASPSDPWQLVGRSPLKNIRVPRDLLHWKIEKKGFQTFEGSLFRTPFQTRLTLKEDSVVAAVTLDEQGKAPVGMVRVSPGNEPIFLRIPGYAAPPVTLQDYWIDKYEVTNAEFKTFVDQGGYQKRQYWNQEFRKDGRVLSWSEGMALLSDATGRPGPAGWVQGEYPAGQGEYPVSGISWYEAAAYAEFVGKSLPSLWHWWLAAGGYSSSWIVPASNFAGQGPARVGTYHGLGPFGTYDMAGNVKEWAWNEAASGQRYILGGGWDEQPYMFTHGDARSAFDRSANFGFRCAKYASGNPASVTSPVPFPGRDYTREKPVSDELFRAYKSLYSYDKTPLNAALESVDDSNEYWKREKITFAAAYGNERVIAYLFLPRKFGPPLQTVVWFPGANGIRTRSIGLLPTTFDFLIKSGRAVLVPSFKGTLERGDELSSDRPNTTSFYRDHVIDWSKDLGRSVDYLETRPEIDRRKLAYFGTSWGAAMGAIMAAVETRFRVCIFHIGGLYLEKTLPEVDQFNFAPRVKIPVLMLNGRWDFIFPVETTQAPLYGLLGAPKDQKRHVLYDGGHNIPRAELIRESLDWLDRYLGPVK